MFHFELVFVALGFLGQMRITNEPFDPQLNNLQSKKAKDLGGRFCNTVSSTLIHTSLSLVHTTLSLSPVHTDCLLLQINSVFVGDSLGYQNCSVTNFT